MVEKSEIDNLGEGGELLYGRFKALFNIMETQFYESYATDTTHLAADLEVVFHYVKKRVGEIEFKLEHLYYES